MEGVRVTGIDPQCSVKVLWQYFEECAGRKGVVKEVYYPLLNNEAVVIFKDPSETAQVLTRRHEKWEVLPLPHQVFTRQRVWVEVDLSMLVQATEAYGDVLRNLGQVEVSAEKHTKQLILTGQSYQIEWAWNYLSSLRDNQYHIAHNLQTGSVNSAVSRLSNGDSLTDDDRTLSRHERSHLNHHASKSPSLNGEARLQDEDRALASAAADVASLGMVSRGSHALSTEASGVSPRTRERVSVHAVHANSVTGSEKEWNNEENVASSSRAMATLDQGSLRSLNARGRHRRQDDANNTFNEFASLPASTAHGDIAPHASSAQHTDPHLSTGSRTRAPSKVLPSTTELSLAEAAHRSERESQSLGFQRIPDHGTMCHYQSLQPMRFDENMDMRDEETRGAYGGHRGQSFLHYSHGASAKMSDQHQFALLSNTSIEMSRKSFTIGKRLKLKIYVDDITKTKTEAVVNAANWELKNIGGVAGALARAAGPEMADECDRLFKRNGRLATAQVVKTKAYGKLNHLKYVIHTVGPIYTPTEKDRSVFELAQTFYNCLQFAEKLNLQSITFPFISTGIFGMPTDDCILALVTALLVFSDERHSNLSFLEEVHFINNDINVVCEAIILAEQRIKIETVETTKQRMEDGKQHYGRYVYPYCAGHSHTASTGCRGDERHGTWDSSQGRDAADSWDLSQHKSDQLTGTTGPQSLQTFRHRSGSLDLARKTVAAGSMDTKSSEKPKGRAPSPLPTARARSNSLTMAGRSSSSSSKNVDSQVHAQTTTTGKHQPVIKQPLVAVKAGTKTKHGSVLKTHGSKGKTSDYSGNDTDTASAASSEVEDSDTKCPICLDTIQQPKKLPCGHRFCTGCIDRAMATNCRCPKCQRYFGISTGTQPRGGTMTYTINRYSHLEGYEGCGIIVINYSIPSGRQETCHPNPGRHYTGIQRTAYLPDNREGNEVLEMLKKAFNQRLVFTIGDSATTGACDVIVWNDIHHKTSTTGGPSNYGYPDPGYLIRVKEELAAKGITSA